MPVAPDKIPENIDIAAQEVLGAPADQRPPMLRGDCQGACWKDNPGIGAREVSERVTAFVKAVRDRL